MAGCEGYNGGAAIDSPVNDGVGGRPYDLIGVGYADGAAVGAAFYGIDGSGSSLLRGGALGVYSNTNLSGAAFDPLGIGLTSSSRVGFDILFSGGVNRAFLSADDSFYSVDLHTGRATVIGGIGIANIRGITTAVPEPSTKLSMILGFGVIGFVVRRRRRISSSMRTTCSTTSGAKGVRRHRRLKRRAFGRSRRNRAEEARIDTSIS